MKRTLPLLLLLLWHLGAFSQSSKSKTSYLLLFQDQVDLQALTAEFREQGLPRQERARQTLRLLQAQHQANKQAFLTKAPLNAATFIIEKDFWIVSALKIQADSSLITRLSANPMVAKINPWDESLGTLTPLSFRKTSIQGPFSSEPGHWLIQAPSMWSQGYSGRGRRLLIVDGVTIPTHPAINEQWLGHNLPLQQVYFEDPKVPMETSMGGHGTAVTSCALGMDHRQSDTTGVAPGVQYFSAELLSGPFASQLPLSRIIEVFQWALNPDQDTSTTQDIPHVINNSWGLVPGTFPNPCQPGLNQILDALEAAGIATVWGAGNEGPAGSSLRFPQDLARNLLNPFAVGAVDPNLPGAPLANFSSRGPSQCSSGVLAIKPEVTAPGKKVRVAHQTDQYTLGDGTSFAAPYVSGACLLLMEAFPNLPGDQILDALYQTASDRGSIGEDNEYGRGIIDLAAAFNYLSQNHNPLPPQDPTWDLAIADFLQSGTPILCNPLLQLDLILENRGDSLISGAQIEYGWPQSGQQVLVWNGSLAAGERDTLSLPSLTISQEGWQEFQVKVRPNLAFAEADTLNNSRIYRYNYRGERNPGFVESFETYSSYGPEWQRFNEDFGLYWDTVSVGGLAGSQKSMALLYATDPAIASRDDLISPQLSMPNSGTAFLNFDLAYQHRGTFLSDSLAILISADCGQTWDRVFYEGGSQLKTTNSIGANFSPSAPDHWRKRAVDLSTFAGVGKVLLKFTGINDNGNNLFIDNIALLDSSLVTSRSEAIAIGIRLWPNPGTSEVHLESRSPFAPGTQIEVLDLRGKIFAQKQVHAPATRIDWNLKGLPSGLYLIKVKERQKVRTFKWVRQ